MEGVPLLDGGGLSRSEHEVLVAVEQFAGRVRLAGHDGVEPVAFAAERHVTHEPDGRPARRQRGGAQLRVVEPVDG